MQFGAALFPACESCRTQAVEVHAALEALAGRSLEDLDAGLGIRAVLGHVLENLPLSTHTSEMDSLDVVEFIMAVEEERGGTLARSELVPLLEDATSDGVFRRLLGPFASVSTWDARTVWLRSVRGIINERSSHVGGCCCPQRDAR
jgi:hypothetical protein